MKRFEFIQTFEQYTDYESDLDRDDDIRRVTLVSGPTPYAYLTFRDYTEKRITVSEAEALLAQEAL